MGRFCLSFRPSRRETVRRAPDAAAWPIQDVGVNHRCVDVAVPEQFLHRAGVVAVGQQVHGEGMSERVAGGRVVDAGAAGGG